MSENLYKDLSIFIPEGVIEKWRKGGSFKA